MMRARGATQPFGLNSAGQALLLIGAQKSATTSLAQHLDLVGLAQLGARKEPGHLSRGTFSRRDLRSYARNFADLDGSPWFLDASTEYTMRTLYPGAARCARSVLGADLKIIYLIREPVARALSHHRHEANRGILPADFDSAAAEHEELLANSCYHFQLEPWVAQFSSRQILLLTMEGYLAEPARTLGRIADYLGADTPCEDDATDAPAENLADRTSFLQFPMLRRMAASPIYLDVVRPRLPRGVRQRMTSLVTTADEVPIAGPSDRMIANMTAQFSSDIDLLAELDMAPESMAVPLSWATGTAS